MNNNYILEYFFNKKLLTELNEYKLQIDIIHNKIFNKNRQYDIKGGSNLDIVKQTIGHLKTIYSDNSKMTISKEELKLPNLKDKIGIFKETIESVITQIEDILKISDNMDDIKDFNKVKDQYTEFIKHIDTILAAKGYRFISDNSINMMINKNDIESNSILWSSIFNTWIPFVTDITQIIKSVDATGQDEESDNATKVYNIITEQLDTIMKIIDSFEIIISQIMEKYKLLIIKPIQNPYFIDKDVAPINNQINYIYKTNDNEQKGIIQFTKTVYNFTKSFDLINTDVFSLVETSKMQFIDNYVNSFSEKGDFMSAVGINFNNKKSIIYTEILEKFKQLEQFSSNTSIQTGGRIVEYDSTKMSQLLLNLTNRIREINQKIKELKSLAVLYEKDQKRMKYYVYYIINISSLKDIKNLNIYKFINRGLLEFFRNIINDIQARISSNKDKMPLDALYFDTYHNLIMRRVKNFLNFIIENISTSTIIDIQSCTGPIKNDFIIFNHFKDILESYYETIQNKVSIYARLNDFKPINPEYIPEKAARLFKKENQYIIANYSSCLTNIHGEHRTDIPQLLNADPANSSCGHSNIRDNNPMDSGNPNNINAKFNMVFDYDEFNDNESIAMYMSISSNISKKKSVNLITYGYSGTGKSYTLFGNGKNEKGLLQSAIEGIMSKKEVYCRIYEIYGAGVKYPFYWCDSVSEKCFVYQLNPVEFNIKNVVESSIDNIIKESNTIDSILGYTKIEAHKVQSFFKKFNNIVDEIDQIRKDESNLRIKETPNNPVSSRSIIIYDLMIRVDNDLVRFAVIDLPGREEIVETYTNDYIVRHKQFDTPFHKAVLSSMCIDPLYLSILCPMLIINAFNNLNPKIRKYIFNQKINIDNLGDCLSRVNNCLFEKKPSDNQSNIIVPPYISTLQDQTDTSDKEIDFMNEIIIKTSGFQTSELRSRKMSELITVSNYTIQIIPNPVYDSTNKMSNPQQIQIPDWWNGSKFYLAKSNTTIQYQGVIALRLLNRILLIKDAIINESDIRSVKKDDLVDDSEEELKYSKFDVLEIIYKYISDHFGYTDYDKMFKAPFEGIYINENIVGILKVLNTNKSLLNKSNDDVMRMICPQADISFEQTKKNIRDTNMELYTIKKTENVERFENKVSIDNDVLNKIYTTNATSYSSQKIFRFCKPTIEHILEYYINDTEIRLDSQNIKIHGTKDVKIFYLFSNVNQDKKCIHQYKLFKNTLGLMKLVDNVNI